MKIKKINQNISDLLYVVLAIIIFLASVYGMWYAVIGSRLH